MSITKTYLNWSSGKDAAFALYQLQQQGIAIDKLVTTVTANLDRVTMHGLRKSVLEKQLACIEIPSKIIELPENVNMEVYDETMLQAMMELMSEGYQQAAFGDIFLEDLRNYRDQQHESAGLGTIYPLWQKDTTELVYAFIEFGFKATIICIDNNLLDDSFLGRTIDAQLLQDLPPNVDPCGENGEFHTFCYDGPIFKQAVDIQLGAVVHKTYPITTSDKNTQAAKFGFIDVL